MKSIGKNENIVVFVEGYIVLLILHAINNRFAFSNSFLNDIESFFEYILPFSLSLTDIIHVIGVFVLALLTIRIGKSLISCDGIFLMIYSMILLCVAFFDPEVATVHNIKESLIIIEIILICYYSSRLFDENDWKTLIFTSIFGSSIIWGIGAAISFYYYIVNYSGFHAFFGDIGCDWCQGMFVFRNYGAFADANLSSVICVLLIVGSVYILLNYEIGIICKVIIYLEIALFVIYICLAFSRTAFVTVFATGLFSCLFYYVRRNSEKKMIEILFKALVRFFIFAIGIVVMYFVVIFACKAVGNLVTPDRDANELVRQEVFDNPDLSNGRFQIWSDYFKVINDRPVFGLSADGSFEYLNKHYPETMASVNGYHNHHNMFVLLMSQVGIVGAVVMLLFMLIPLLRFLYFVLIKRIEFSKYLYLLFLFAMIVLIEGLFYDAGFTDIRVDSVILWLSIGGIFTEISRRARVKVDLAQKL